MKKEKTHTTLPLRLARIRGGYRISIVSALASICFSVLLLTVPFWSLQSSGLSIKPANSPWVAGKIGDEADAFFDDTFVHEINLYFNTSQWGSSQNDWYAILFKAHDTNPDDPYFPAKFVSHGVAIDSVGVRFKGLSSFGGSSFPSGNQGVKKPFCIDFNEYDEDSDSGEETTFFGLKKLDLNNGFSDATMLREKLFSDFASKYVETPRSVYARLYINDEYYGIYLAMEHIDNTYVESRFGGDEEGNIFKVEYNGTLEYRGTEFNKYNGLYELKNNEETNNWSDLIELTDILTNTALSDLPTRLEPIFDVKSGLRYLALLSLFSNLDSYIGTARNYYLYDRDDNGKFTLLLCDANLAFGALRLLLKPGENETSLDPFPPSFMRTPGGLPPSGGSICNLPLIEKVLAIESYNRTYLRVMAKMLREGFNADAVNARVQQLADIIRASVYDDPHFLSPQAAFESGLAGITSFVAERSAYLDARLNDFAGKTDLSINELMALNQGTISDSNGDYDPWAEIYNLGPGQAAVNEIFLTDNLEVPNKWQLSTQHLMDGGFLLLWLDGEPNEGAYHSPFSLKAGGGELYLYMRSGLNYELVDNVTYPALPVNVSYSRYPDGEDSWFELAEDASPGQSNQLGGVPAYLFINEFMADNKASVIGPDGTYPDWIELFNAGNKTVDLSGMYLTDDLANPTTWSFPNGTSIGPDAYLIVWADKSHSQGSLHAGFALSANGEKIGLFARDGETNIDYIIYDEQFDDASYGRFSDGGSIWDFLAPTPGSANKLGARSVSTKPTASPTGFLPSASPSNSPTNPGATQASSQPVSSPTNSTVRSDLSPSPSPSQSASLPPTLTPTLTSTPTSSHASPPLTSPSQSQMPPDTPPDSNILAVLVAAFLAAIIASVAVAVVMHRKKR